MRKTIKISGKDIKRIIKDTINDNIATMAPNTMLNEVATMDRINLNEMILNTVPPKKVISYLISGFNFATPDNFDNNTHYGIVQQARDNVIQLWIRGEDEEDVVEIMGKLGWLCGARNLYRLKTNEIGRYANAIGLVGLQFEKKFDEDMTDVVFNQRFLYHYAPTILLDKIKKQGLVPKSNTWALFGGKGKENDAYKNTNDTTSHGRIFFFLAKQMIDKKEYFKPKFGNKEVEMSLLMVDVGKIPKDVKFYKDPKQAWAVYTYNNIPPQAIKVAD